MTYLIREVREKGEASLGHQDLERHLFDPQTLDDSHLQVHGLEALFGPFGRMLALLGFGQT